MNDWNEIPILFMTRFIPGREGIAKRVIEAIHRHIICKDGLQSLRWYITANDGPDYIEQLEILIAELGVGEVADTFNINIPPGKRWNMAVASIFQEHEFYLRLEDDFELNANMDLTPWINVLLARPEVGMIRLGLMPIDLHLFSKGIDGQIYFECLKESQYAYSGNPGLIHRSLHDSVGLFHMEKNPGDIETDFDARYRACATSPMILWPLLLGKYGTYGAWNHIGEVKSYE